MNPTQIPCIPTGEKNTPVAKLAVFLAPAFNTIQHVQDQNPIMQEMAKPTRIIAKQERATARLQLSQKCTTNYGGGSGSGFISNMALVKVSKNVICVMTGSPSHRDCANSTLAHTHMLYMSSE